jgi:hypothetical protein
VRCLSATLILGLVVGCADTQPENFDVLPRPPPDGWGQLRIVHVAQDLGTVDVYLREVTEPLLTSLAIGFAQGFVEIAARDYTIDLRQAAASPHAETLASLDFSMVSRARVTLVMASSDPASWVLFDDDLARIDLGALRLVNATSSGELSFDFGADGSNEVTGLAAGAVGRATLANLAPTTLSVTADGGAQTYALPARPSTGDVVIIGADTTTLMLTYSFSIDALSPP